MQFNTAIAVLASGGALLFRESKKMVGFTLSFFVASVGFLTTSEHIFGIDFKVDQLVSLGSGIVYTDHPGRMALLSSLSFFFIGISQAVSYLPHFKNTRLSFSAFLSSIPVGLGLSTLICHLVNLNHSFQVGSFVKMAPATSLSIVILGLSNLMYCLSEFKKSKNASTQIFPLLIFTSLHLLSFLVWQISFVHEKKISHRDHK